MKSGKGRVKLFLSVMPVRFKDLVSKNIRNFPVCVGLPEKSKWKGDLGGDAFEFDSQDLVHLRDCTRIKIVPTTVLAVCTSCKVSFLYVDGLGPRRVPEGSKIH